jgi:cytochrome P450
MVGARREALRRGAGPETPDLLAMLMASEGFDDRQLRDEIVTLIVAGHETVATSLTWTWHLLGQNREVRDKLIAEVDEVLKGERPRFEHLSQLIYTRQVIDESLRLYPPAWVISRRALINGDVMGVEVPAGSYVFVSPYVLHRTKEYWPDPQTFNPERFAAGAGEQNARFTYIPFGAGPNLCIGRDLALMEAVLVVAAVASTCTLDPVIGHQVKLDPLVTIRPHGGLPMVLKKRF